MLSHMGSEVFDFLNCGSVVIRDEFFVQLQMQFQYQSCLKSDKYSMMYWRNEDQIGLEFKRDPYLTLG